MPAQLGLGLAALGRPGYVTLGHADDLGGRYDPSSMEAHAHAVLDAAYESGIRYIDVARSYGRAEEFVASWLRSRHIAPREIVIASKWGYTYTAGWSTSAAQHEIKDHSVATFERQLAESVERLGDYLSLYQIHSVTADCTTLDDDALIDALVRLRDGNISIGLTVSGPGQDIAIRRALEVRHHGVFIFDFVQATWNLLERGAESALEDAHAAGRRVVVKEVLANGRLTDANHEEDPVLSPRVALVRALAAERGQSIESLALGAALGRPWADVVLTGAATVEQLRVSLATAKVHYGSELDRQLRAASLPSSEYWKARSSFAWN